jgi:hypothetical protein
MADPIFWSNQQIARPNRQMRARDLNEHTGVLEPVIDPVTRRPLIERVPQRGHDGDSDPKQPRLAPGRRWMHVLRHDGNEVRVPITTAAAPVEDSNYGAWIQAKARHFGWIPFGHCPVALLLTGMLRPFHLVADKLKDEQPCQHGSYGAEKACAHYLLERLQRRALHATLQARRDAETESMESKALRAQQATAEGILELGRHLMSQSAQPNPPPPPAEPNPPPPKPDPETAARRK